MPNNEPLGPALRDYVRACFPGIWVVSDEPEEALREIATLCRNESWRMSSWDIDVGWQPANEAANDATSNDPLTALEVVSQFATDENPSLLVLRNYHHFLRSPEVMQRVEHCLEAGKRQRTFLVILAPIVDLPRELEKLFVIVDHPLPSHEQLETIARELATEPGELPEENELAAVISAAAGLTRTEAEGAISLSLVRDGTLRPETIWRVKAQQLRKSGLLSVYEGPERLSDLGGLASLKEFCLRAITSGSGNEVHAKGVLLLSPPGCGKSAIGKALGNETSRPTLRLDIGQLMGSLVGQTETNVRKAIAIAEAMAPCVLLIDEIDKALTSVGSGQGDSGVSARLFGTLLSWLADRTSDVFVVGTANRIDHLPAELTRAERFDGIFFVDLSSREEKQAIWQLHREAFEIEEQPLPGDDQWTGAEIRACCRLAKLLGESLVEASQRVVPVADAYVDKGYRGHDYQGEAAVHIAGNNTKKLSRSQKKKRKRRSAVEPKIGHLKSDNRLGRCFLKGLAGDAINVILAAAGSNLRKLMRAVACALRFWLLDHLLRLPNSQKSQ